MVKPELRSLLWLPVDVPLFPVTEALLSHTKTESFHFWDFYRLTIKQATPYMETEWSDEVKVQHPEVVEWVKCLPIKTLRNVKLNLQQSPVAPHVDFTRPKDAPDLWANNAANEPCGYRVVLAGSNERVRVWTSDRKSRVCRMPEDTNVYLLRQTDGWHSVDEDTDRFTLYIHMEVDAEAHRILLDRSLAKYADYAIYDTLVSNTP